MNDFTRLLCQIDSGDQQAAADLLPLVYQELRNVAKAKMARERPGQTLQTTALVHEAFLRLVGSENAQRWDNSRHFFAAAAEAMRRILIDRARQKARLKHGGAHERVELSPDMAILPMACDDILGLDEALEKLEATNPRKAELVKLRFFAGLTVPQAAEALGVSTSTAENDWAYARSWLKVEMSDRE